MHNAGIGVLILLEIGKYLIPFGVAFAAALKWGQKIADYFYNREFETWLVSYTHAGEVDPITGKRKLYLDNVGSPERFPDAVRGWRARSLMLSAAKRCSLEGYARFVLMKSDHQELMLHAARNALTKHWSGGVVRKTEGLPVVTRKLHFAVTGSDTTVNGKKMFRIPIFTREDAHIFLNHPVDMWEFDDPHHAVRLETMQMLAMSLIHGESRTSFGKNGSEEKIPLVGWFRIYVAA